VIPVFNEVATIQEVLRRVRTVGVPLELLVVDDGSLDGTRDLLLGLDPADDLKILLQDTNQGKGAALKCGFVESTGDIVAIQDGDLEYDPRDLRLLLPPLLNHEADVVYGSRFGYARELVSYYVHQRGNELITRLSNWRTKLPLTDVETCYKVVRGDWIRQIAPTLCERRFGVELELTAKLARMPGARFCERPISYAGRSFREGKKIGWRDAVRAMWCILKY
jgi:glycosyltransferase involved in cell wall biosynthesis